MVACGFFSDLFLVVISVVISRTVGMSINFPWHSFFFCSEVVTILILFSLPSGRTCHSRTHGPLLWNLSFFIARPGGIRREDVVFLFSFSLVCTLCGRAWPIHFLDTPRLIHVLLHLFVCRYCKISLLDIQCPKDWVFDLILI